MSLEGLKYIYRNNLFLFKNLYKNKVIYENILEDKSIIVYGYINYKSDLSLQETLEYLDSKIEITEIEIRKIKNKNHEQRTTKQ